MASTAEPEPTPRAPGDPVAARLKALIDVFESAPDAIGPRALRRPGRAEAESPEPAEVEPPSGSRDLDRQVEVLRRQLEAAFAAIEQRFHAMEARNEQAERQARLAEARATAAAALADSILSSVEEMRSSLTRASTMSAEAGRTHLRDTLRRLHDALLAARSTTSDALGGTTVDPPARPSGEAVSSATTAPGS